MPARSLRQKLMSDRQIHLINIDTRQTFLAIPYLDIDRQRSKISWRRNKTKAQEMAQTIRVENGVKTACDEIEDFLSES